MKTTTTTSKHDHFAGVHAVFGWMGHHGTATLIILAVLYLLFHRHHYRRNRRGGLGFWVSMRGPWGTRISRRF